MRDGVDPKITAILPLLPLKDAANLTPKRARDELIALADLRKDVPLPQPGLVEDLMVQGANGAIAARLYRATATSSTSVVFFHGGGWVAGDLLLMTAMRGRSRWLSMRSCSASTIAGRRKCVFLVPSRMPWPRPAGLRAISRGSEAMPADWRWRGTAPADSPPHRWRLDVGTKV